MLSLCTDLAWKRAERKDPVESAASASLVSHTTKLALHGELPRLGPTLGVSEA